MPTISRPGEQSGASASFFASFAVRWRPSNHIRSSCAAALTKSVFTDFSWPRASVKRKETRCLPTRRPSAAQGRLQELVLPMGRPRVSSDRRAVPVSGAADLSTHGRPSAPRISMEILPRTRKTGNSGVSSLVSYQLWSVIFRCVAPT